MMALSQWLNSVPPPRMRFKWTLPWLLITTSPEMRMFSNKRGLPGERSFKIQASDATSLVPNLITSPMLDPRPWKKLHTTLLIFATILESKIQIPLLITEVTSNKKGTHSNLPAANILELLMISSKNLSNSPLRRVTLSLFSMDPAAMGAMPMKTVNPSLRPPRKTWSHLIFLTKL